ncbi:MAG: cbb3-type cytochrome oxidase subunit 3 [Sulfuriferula sp.]
MDTAQYLGKHQRNEHAQPAKEKKMNSGGYVIYTVILLLAFVSIAIWAFSKKRKARFDKDATIPFEEDRD